ncbi:hypothetical protein INR49_005127 [Caranx melampygus]|nr:hypothetical protein INR49_005127 [Caranx melampygus]
MERSSWSGSESPGEDMDRLSDSGGDKTMDGDPEGVWSPDIEQSFQEALAIYPPCGRRKIILSDEGKMYGIQSYSSFSQKKIQGDQNAKEKALQSISSMSSAQIVSATAIHSKLLPGIVRASFPGNPQLWQGMIPGGQSSSTTEDIKPFSQQAYNVQTAGTTTISGYEPPTTAQTHREPAWQGRSIGTTKLRLVEFSSFLETQRDQEAADLNYNVQDDPAAFYGVTSQYESSENMTITCSTKVCSFGKQVVEKVETEYARFENGRFVYRISRSPMCEYMINFIHKLKHLPEKYMMNSVLENFTILLVVSNRDTQETLLCMACVFERPPSLPPPPTTTTTTTQQECFNTKY